MEEDKEEEKEEEKRVVEFLGWNSPVILPV